MLSCTVSLCFNVPTLSPFFPPSGYLAIERQGGIFRDGAKTVSFWWIVL